MLSIEIGEKIIKKNEKKNKHMADGKLKAEENFEKVNPIQIANLSINYPPPSIPWTISANKKTANCRQKGE
jgi:hypothetical protein